MVDLGGVLPRTPQPWRNALISALPGFPTAQEQAAFIATLAVESGEFTDLLEDMDYSAARLTQVWPTEFPTLAAATPYAGNPIGLANFIYANKMGNGDVNSGDGWSFRGRGPIQITGRWLYTAAGVALAAPLVGHPELLLTPTLGVKSAAWFWNYRVPHAVGASGSMSAVTRCINGGQTDLPARIQYYTVALAALQAPSVG